MLRDTGRHRGPLLDKLQALFENARLPTSPAIARRILRLIEDPGSSAAQFAAIIAADPAMAARLVRMANSAAYAQRQPVTTIQRAVTVVGLAQLRVVALGFELVGHLDRLGRCRFDLRRFWREAAQRACLAREVALVSVPACAEEAFLVGLLQDCGIVMLVQGLGADYAELYRAHQASPAEFHRHERQSFPYTHVDAIDALASLWKFPPSIARPLARHHKPTRLGGRSPDGERLCAVSHLVGSLGAGASGLDTGWDGLGDDLRRAARDDLKLARSDWARCADAAEAAYRRMVPMLDDDLDEPCDVTDLLVLANRHLQRQTSERDERLRRLEQEHGQVLDEQVTLQKALGQYRERAARDPLTGLLNRQALSDETELCVERAVAASGSVTVLFVDVDDFKPINDTFGHQAGDDVLRAVAALLLRAAGPDGLAGRYGGEEFVLVLPDLGADEARRRATDILESIRRLRVKRGDRSRSLTASIGAVCCVLENVPTAESLFAAADELMYQAKRGGKDRCCFTASGSAALARSFGAADAGDCAA